MNKTIQRGKWKSIWGKVKVWWSKLTDNELDRIAGRFEILVGIVQDRNGYSRRQAVRVVSQRIMDYRTGNKYSQTRSKYD